MRLKHPALDLYHSVAGSFRELLSQALLGKTVGVALGPIYRVDPAEELVRPFLRADAEAGWRSWCLDCSGIPHHIWTQVRMLRQGAVESWLEKGVPEHKNVGTLNDWARAGLVLEICRRRGINVIGLGRVHVDWKLNATVTGRFGARTVEGKGPSWQQGFNPLTISMSRRHLIVPSDKGRIICVMDFRAMDLCSMISSVPGLDKRYEGSTDHHKTTAQLLFGDPVPPELRELCKREIFVHAYGGESVLRSDFEEKLPELDWARRQERFPQMVQEVSAQAFRGALSEALPNLLGDGIVPMFTVHDELVLDVGEDQVAGCLDLCATLERGARRAVGVPYFVEPKFGSNYAEAKKS